MMHVILTVALAFELGAATADLESAVIRGDRAEIERLMLATRDAIEEAPEEERDELRHLFAYASWRLASYEERGSKPYKKMLEAAEDELDELLDRRPDHAEARALYGTVQGWLVTGMWSGMRRGPRSDKAYKRARELAPDNPRVAMHQGVSRLFRPGAFGGGLDKAEEELTEAMELFEKEAPGGDWPSWGHAEILGWMGQVMYRKGELEQARAYYERALEMEPEYHWVLEFLLPELEATAP